MRKLIATCALLLSASAAMAQADKAPAVTKLPGEEKLSIRERAERDFLMPIRHKKMAEVSKVTASSAELESTAAPELDATAHYAEAAEARPEEVAMVMHSERHTALRHHSAATKAKATKRSSKNKKTTAHRATKKVAARKTKTKTKKATTHHAAAKKVTKTKAKSASTHRRRR